MVNFLSLVGVPGVAQISATGQSPAGDVLKAANTIGRAAIPGATASRGTVTPAIEAVAASAAGSRAASDAARSTTQPTTAMDSNGSLLMPKPWISIRPLSVLRRPHQQLARLDNHLNPVVSHKASERQQPLRRGIDEIPCQQRFARAGRPPNENGLGSGENGRGMNGGIRRHQVAGRRTMKRAPSTRDGWPPMRFSTRIVPPCASTICLEIDRPSPEF